MARSHRFWLVAAAGLTLTLPGCGGSEAVKVTGTVMLDGSPLADAQLVFWPTEDLSLGSFGGKTDSQGRFIIRQDRRQGSVKPGRYVILVTKGGATLGPGEGVALPQHAGNPANRNSLPKKYGDKKESPFVFEIDQGNNELPPLELTSR